LEELQDRAGVSASFLRLAMSQHLAVSRAARLVREQKEGRFVNYEVDQSRISCSLGIPSGGLVLDSGATTRDNWTRRRSACLVDPCLRPPLAGAFHDFTFGTCPFLKQGDHHSSDLDPCPAVALNSVLATDGLESMLDE
jgi:hypothetical protein